MFQVFGDKAVGIIYFLSGTDVLNGEKSLEEQETFGTIIQ